MVQHNKSQHQTHQGLQAWIKDGLISIFLPTGLSESVTEDFVQ